MHNSSALVRPRRIARRRGRHFPLPEGAIYVGRPTMWNNPFSGRQWGHAKSVKLHRRWLNHEIGVLPSQIMARRPDYMIAENAAPMKALPPVLRDKLKRITSAWNAVQGYKQPGHAWQFDPYEAHNYLPGTEDASPLPAMTLVPADDFGEELDQIGQPGMEYGFHSIAGLCPLTDPDTLDQWFTSLRLGAELLAAAADLIDFDPAKVRP